MVLALLVLWEVALFSVLSKHTHKVQPAVAAAPVGTIPTAARFIAVRASLDLVSV